jgi:hypothetical protein
MRLLSFISAYKTLECHQHSPLSYRKGSDAAKQGIRDSTTGRQASDVTMQRCNAVANGKWKRIVAAKRGVDAG